MILHILNKSPVTSSVYQQALSAMGAEDRLLLIEDAVQGGLPQLSCHFEKAAGRLFVLQEDMDSRGLGGRQDPAVSVVDVDGFVRLTEQAVNIVSWF
ncbi:sulfurtransferase complex subunit TusB [Aidingimonas lacisalsi]|uniref:sulfurtransferase complex subunit TusB n=1 Tax=Aidingimonas lacisalsi TaxID=2604086 RepID=UPI0011D2BB74|nr:sulfurtransferase complex subunit TusB [Aidingimonas lacisalsi]